MASVEQQGVNDNNFIRETALNGDYSQTTATIDLSDNSSFTRMEDMLRVATDLQNNSTHSSMYKFSSSTFSKSF